MSPELLDLGSQAAEESLRDFSPEKEQVLTGILKDPTVVSIDLMLDSRGSDLRAVCVAVDCTGHDEHALSKVAGALGRELTGSSISAFVVDVDREASAIGMLSEFQLSKRIVKKNGSLELSVSTPPSIVAVPSRQSA